MTLAYTYDGAAITQKIAPSGINITHRADGDPSQGGLPIEDPAAALTMVGWKPVTVEESECAAQPRLFTGFTMQRDIGRSLDEGLFVGEDARLQDLTVTCLNAIFGFRVITRTGAGGGNRPAETWADRLTWILESEYLSDWISADQTWVVTNTTMMEETDYRGGYAASVMEDLVDRSGGAYLYFAFWDTTADEIRLFFDNDNETIGLSTISISNDWDDVDNDYIFAPDSVAKLAREADQTYSDVVVTYDRGAQKVYRYHPSTAMAYVRRGTEIQRPYTRGVATATAQGEKFLDKHAVEVDRITCSIQVPANRVGLIEAGQGMTVRFTHLPGYETDTVMRIVSYSPKPTDDMAAFYDVALELVGARPAAPTVTAHQIAFTMSGSAHGHVRVLMAEPATAGWSAQLAKSGSAPGGGNEPSPGIGVHWQSGTPTQITEFTSFDAGGWLWVAEVCPDAYGTITTHAGQLDVVGDHTLAFVADGPGMILVVVTQTNADGCGMWVPVVTTPGFVKLWDSSARGGREWASTTIGYLPVAAAGSYDITWTTGNCNVWAGWTGLSVFLADPAEYLQSTDGAVLTSGGNVIVTLPDPLGGCTPPDEITDLGPTPGATTTHTTDPTVTDDAAAGYTVGSTWINTTTGSVFVLVDSTTGAAVWVSTSPGTVYAPTTADYLVGTAQAGLSAEIVVGATPGGELGGTWASPTVDATHSGSAHLALGSTSSTAAAGDHTHATDPGRRILIADGHATPFDFTDLLQMDDGSDFLWSD